MGSLGAGGSGGGFNGSGGAPAGFAPGNIGFGYYPAFLGDKFPNPFLSKYKPLENTFGIDAAPYNFTDVMNFARGFGSFNREELQKNFDQSKNFALNTLDTELRGLQGFVPAASALKRRETALDNTFNQAERTRQIDSTLPEVRGQLNEQGARAEAFASGRAPDSVTDRALELGVRSAAADNANAGGFGASSSVARKTSDLMSAEDRIRLSQYGDQLLTGNINQKSSLLLAPTEYSDAGSQIRVTPEVGAGQLTSQNFQEVNQNTLISPTNALSSTVQQNQYVTGLEQETRKFNSSNALQLGIFNTGNKLQNNQFNASTKNQFALDKFQYLVGYAGAVAGAGQTNSNTSVELAQQAQYGQIFQDQMNATQNSVQQGAIAQGITTAIAPILQGISSLINTFKGDEASTDISSGDGGYGAPGSVVVPEGETPPSGYTPVATGSSGGTVYAPPSSSSSVTQPPSDSSAPIVVGPTDTAPSGYIPVGTDANTGGTIYAPPDSPDTSSFLSDVGLESLSTNAQTGITRSLLRSGTTTLNGAGIYSTPQPGSVQVGVSNSGSPVYASRAALSSNDTSAGSKQVSTLQKILDPLGVFSKEDSTAMDKLATVAGDASLMATLAAQYQAGDKRGFANTILNAVKQPTIDSLTKDPRNKAGLNAAFSAFQLFNNWGRMSGAQKGLGIATLGLQGYKFADGTDLSTKPIIEAVKGADGKILQPGLTVGQGISLFQAGYNTYSLAKNWNQLNTLQKIAYGAGDAAQIASLAQNFGLLGAGTGGASVAGVTTSSLANAGFTSTPSLGVGAITGPAANIPQGFTAVAQAGSGEVVAVPTANVGSTAVSPLISNVAGGAAVVLGANQVYKGWGTGGSKGTLNGALGGASMSAGLYALGATNPYLLAGVVAVSVLGNAIHTGKNADQTQRDAVRSRFKDVGLAFSSEGDDFNVTLADGSKYNIGVDGHGGTHQVTNPALLSADQKGKITKLQSFDVDYTNDLDYAAGMAGTTLSRLISGGKNKAIDQMGGQLANASLGNVGYGQQFTEENFGKVAANLRASYAQSGIKSKTDALQLANQAYAEGRMDDSDHAAALQSINFIFDDNGFQTAQKLMAGRQRGLDVIPTLPVEAPKANTEKLPAFKPNESFVKFGTPGQATSKRPMSLSREEMQNINRSRYLVGAAA